MSLARALVVIVIFNLLFLEPLAAVKDEECKRESRWRMYFKVMRMAGAQTRNVISPWSSVETLHKVMCVLIECQKMPPGCTSKIAMVTAMKKKEDMVLSQDNN